jgi:shikimate dehydrogenase
MTRPYAEVIGDPIAHSKSPLIHNFWLEKLGIDADYRSERVTQAELPGYFTARRGDPFFRGCNITMPLKEAALPLLDTVQRGAAAIGAVNTVRRGEDGRLHGRNSDVHGVWRAMDGIDLADRSALLIGTGGAARAAAYALKRCEIDELIVMCRNSATAHGILDEFGLAGTSVPFGAFPPAAVLINATPLGMVGKPWGVLDFSLVSPDAVAFDMVYQPVETEFLIRAADAGLRCVGGLTMLIHQAAEAFATLFGVGAPRQHDAELRERLLA